MDALVAPAPAADIAPVTIVEAPYHGARWWRSKYQPPNSTSAIPRMPTNCTIWVIVLISISRSRTMKGAAT